MRTGMRWARRTQVNAAQDGTGSWQGGCALRIFLRQRILLCQRKGLDRLLDLDPVLLSRLQFAWVIGWHILMPAFTVGMASYIAILEGTTPIGARAPARRRSRCVPFARRKMG